MDSSMFIFDVIDVLLVSYATAYINDSTSAFSTQAVVDSLDYSLEEQEDCVLQHSRIMGKTVEELTYLMVVNMAIEYGLGVIKDHFAMSVEESLKSGGGPILMLDRLRQIDSDLFNRFCDKIGTR